MSICLCLESATQMTVLYAVLGVPQLEWLSPQCSIDYFFLCFHMYVFHGCFTLRPWHDHLTELTYIINS